MKSGEEYEVKEIVTTRKSDGSCFGCCYENIRFKDSSPANPCNLCNYSVLFVKRIELIRIR